MTLQHYLKHRRRYEMIAFGVMLLLIGATNATSIILKASQDDVEPRWLEAFATEYTAVFALPFVLPLFFAFLNWLNLNLQNIRWRVLWHIPGFIVFALLYVGLFNLFRKLLWPLAGQEYVFGPIVLGLVYEMRKLFWVYLLLVTIFYSYRFILDRLQGEARFLSESYTGNPQSQYREQFLVKMLDREYLVRVKEIEWVQSASNYVLLHCGSRQYPMRQTLKGLSEQLDPQRFVRVHRTAIANLDQIESLQDKGDVRLSLVSGATLPVSKTYLPALRQTLAGDQIVDSTWSDGETRP